jgi:ABC-type phosphate transport system auxiliary subunit
MKANKLLFWGGLAVTLILTVVMADNPTPVDPKEKELDELLKQSQSRMEKVNSLVKKIDQVASTEVTTMKENIETLQEEKIELTAEKDNLIEEKQKLTHALYETKAVLLSRDSAIPAPFKLEPILPLSED